MPASTTPAAGTYVTRGVLAGAYLRGDTRRAMLTHVVELGADGLPARVLCARASVDNLADEHAKDPSTEAAQATCSVCCARDPRTYPPTERVTPSGVLLLCAMWQAEREKMQPGEVVTLRTGYGGPAAIFAGRLSDAGFDGLRSVAHPPRGATIAAPKLNTLGLLVVARFGWGGGWYRLTDAGRALVEGR